MALVNSSFTVNVTPGAMPPTVHVSEYDIGRTYTVTINGQNGSAFNIPAGTTATIEGTLNGSVGFTQSATISNNQVSFALSESMTAYSGKAWCKIKLTLNDEPIQTCAFILDVDRAGVEADTILNSPGFQEQINEGIAEYFDNDPPFFELPSGGQSGQALLSDGADGAYWGQAQGGGAAVTEQYVTPEQFGAKGDGVTDDATALQNAMDFAAKNRARLVIPGKTYLIKTALGIPNNLHLLGMSKVASVLKMSGIQKCLYSLPDETISGYTYTVTCGAHISNLCIMSDYRPDTSGVPEHTDGAIDGAFIGCVIEHINFIGCPVGLVTKQPNFRTSPQNHYNIYNTKYGDEKLFNDLSIHDCYKGIIGKQADCDYMNIRVGQCYDSPLELSVCTLTNAHVWMFGNSNILHAVRAVNIEIEAPYWYDSTVKIHALRLIKTNVANLYIWNFYKPEGYTKQVNYGSIVLCDRVADPSQISNFQFGSDEYSGSSSDLRIIKTPLVEASVADHSMCIVNSLAITWNYNTYSPTEDYASSELFVGSVVVDPYSIEPIVKASEPGKYLTKIRTNKPRYLDTVDAALSSTSTYPVQNKVVSEAIYDTYPTSSSSGSIASFSDGAAVPLVSVTVDANATKIYRTGKNLLPPLERDETVSGVLWHLNDDGSVMLSGTATSNSIKDFGRGVLTLKPGTYCTNLAQDNVVCAIWANSSPASMIDGAGGAFTLTEETPIFIRFYVPSGTTVSTIIYPQLERGNAITDYEPYQGEEITVDSGSVPEIVGYYGVNNIWADTGNVTVVYRADPTLYINKKIAAELPAVTASDNGKFLRVVSGAWAAETVSTWQGGSY